MSSRWALAAVLAALLLAWGCKGAAPTPAAPRADAGAPPPTITFSFGTNLQCASGGLCAAPSQVVQIQLASTADGTVDLALAGNYADAALAASTVAVVGGHAQVTLQTSSTPTTFSVLARPSGAPTALGTALAIAVGASGFARVLAVPSYAGNRTATAFLATAVVLSTCAELDGTASSDAGSPAGSAQPWLSEPAGTPIALSVPADERLAIEVRVGHYVSGCADVAPLAATTTSTVSVTAYDVPMALDQTDMNATFTFALTSSQSSAWTSALSAAAGVGGEDAGAADTVAGAFFDTTNDLTPDGSALLDAMYALVPSADQAAFKQSRMTGGWDAATQTWLGAHAPSMNARAVAWLVGASTDGPGPLVLHLGPGTVLNTDAITVTTFGPLSATLSGITTPHSFSWSADADDTVHLAGTLRLDATAYIAHEADAHAASAVTGATDVPSAIALEIDCGGLSTSLVGSGDAYGTCDAACVATLCAQAIGATWSAAAASGGSVLQMSLTLGAPAQVGDTAEPIYFGGSWLGQVTGATNGTIDIEGAVTGLAAQSP